MSAAAQSPRPPRAVVGSQISRDEEMFGAAYDRRVGRRFAAFVRPYGRWLLMAVGAVLVFTGAQLLIPLIIRHAIDHAILAEGGDVVQLRLTAAAFGVVILVSYGANYMQDRLVGHIGEHVIFDLRRAMFAHLQDVSLSFMDKTEVGRMMSRLQGDVNSLQEFLENSVTAFGDLLLLIGIVVIMLTLHLELGLLTLVLVPTLAMVRMVWLPRARIAFRRARETNSIANGALAEAIHAVRTVQGMRREDVNYVLYGDKAADNLNAHLRASPLRPGHGADRRYPDRGGARHSRRAGRVAGARRRAGDRGDGGLPVLRPALLRSRSARSPSSTASCSARWRPGSGSSRCSTFRSPSSTSRTRFFPRG